MDKRQSDMIRQLISDTMNQFSEEANKQAARQVAQVHKELIDAYIEVGFSKKKAEETAEKILFMTILGVNQ